MDKKYYKCCGKNCPGMSYRASERAHPWTCLSDKELSPIGEDLDPISIMPKEENKPQEKKLYTVTINRLGKFFRKTTWDVVAVETGYSIRCVNVVIQILIDTYEQATVRELVERELCLWEEIMCKISTDNLPK